MNYRTSKVETLTLIHLIFLGVFSSWALGGGSAFSRNGVCLLGSAAPLITLAAFISQQPERRSNFKMLLGLVPWLCFNAVVILGIRQPSYFAASVEGIQVFVPRNDLTNGPSCARPDLAWHELWLFDAIVLSAFNLLVAVRHRRTLRTLFILLAVNALLLSIFGSVQRFLSASGIFFGEIPSPNSTFFASFIYHNHWGAYLVLMLGIALGLLFNLRPWSGYRDFWHSPASVAVVIIFFLSATIPLSGSRSCTFLSILLLASATIYGLRRVMRHFREQKRSVLLPLSFLVLALGVSALTIFILARESIETRLTDTQTMLVQMKTAGSIGARSQLYRDTWHMAEDRLAFGWGLGSYGTVFRNYNTLQSTDGLPQYYEYAHSDWLQLLAETGLTGAAFYLAFLCLNLRPLLRAKYISLFPRYVLAGCVLILLYAFIEFPFGNAAVTFLFWICFFGSIRWVVLDQTGKIPAARPCSPPLSSP